MLEIDAPQSIKRIIFYSIIAIIGAALVIFIIARNNSTNNTVDNIDIKQGVQDNTATIELPDEALDNEDKDPAIDYNSLLEEMMNNPEEMLSNPEEMLSNEEESVNTDIPAEFVGDPMQSVDTTNTGVSNTEFTQYTLEPNLEIQHGVTLQTKLKLVEIRNFLIMDVLNTGFEEVLRYSNNEKSKGNKDININVVLDKLKYTMERKNGYTELINETKGTIYESLIPKWASVNTEIDTLYNSIMSIHPSSNRESYRIDITSLTGAIDNFIHEMDIYMGIMGFM